MSNEQPHDPTVTLRIELGRVTDQRNAFQSALHKDVLKVIYDATLAADAGFADTVGDLEKQVGDLQMENAYLKAEVERLKNNCDYLDRKLDEEIQRAASFAGEISRLNDAIMTGNAITPDARIVP